MSNLVLIQRKWLGFLAISFFLSSCLNQSMNTSSNKDSLKGESIAYYNVENLFDTIDARGVNDKDFLPSSHKNWNSKKYLKKLSDIRRVMDDLGPNGPAIIGLSEVENKDVLQALLKVAPDQSSNYQILHYNSPDTRGIDNALLYKSNLFTLEDSESIRIQFPSNPNVKSRDILYAKLRYSNSVFFHVFVNHWPSRRDGTTETEIKRLEASKTLSSAIKPILDQDSNAFIIVLGDFNDEPTDQSISKGIDACLAQEKSKTLYNAMGLELDRGKGTIVHNSEWLMFDQIMYAPSLMPYLDESAEVFSPDYLLYTKYDGSKVPNKTYGSTYFGGFSDHLPVRIFFRTNPDSLP